eukprot:scaffold3294_cov253-Pinguiococcus_pyrenoidosus.AAC.3
MDASRYRRGLRGLFSCRSALSLFLELEAVLVVRAFNHRRGQGQDEQRHDDHGGDRDLDVLRQALAGGLSVRAARVLGVELERVVFTGGLALTIELRAEVLLVLHEQHNEEAGVEHHDGEDVRRQCQDALKPRSTF